MLITFKSHADGDVIMFGADGKQMLATLGKDPGDPQGIVTVMQLPAAIEALLAAIERDKTEHPAEDDEDDDWGRTAEEIRLRNEKRRERGIHFAQRAVPLLAMLQHSLRAETPVIWES